MKTRCPPRSATKAVPAQPSLGWRTVQPSPRVSSSRLTMVSGIVDGDLYQAPNTFAAFVTSRAPTHMTAPKRPATPIASVAITLILASASLA